MDRRVNDFYTMKISIPTKTGILGFILCITFSGALFLYRPIYKIAQTHPLFPLGLQYDKQYMDTDHCMKTVGDSFACSPTIRTTEATPSDVYPVEWGMQPIPMYPFLLPLPKGHEIKYGYEKYTLDVYSWNSKPNPQREKVFFGLFFDQSCPMLIHCNSYLTFDLNEMPYVTERSFIDKEENLIVKQIRAESEYGETRRFFMIIHDGMRTFVQYYPDTDFKNIDVAWTALSNMHVRTLNETIKGKERMSLQKELEENPEKVPGNWKYFTMGDLPFTLRFGAQPVVDRSRIDNQYDYLPYDVQLLVPEREYFDVVFSPLPDPTFTSEKAHISVIPIGEWKNEDLVRGACTAIDKAVWTESDGIRVAEIPGGCKDAQYVYEYQHIYYFLKIIGSNAPHLKDMVMHPHRRVTSDGRAAYMTYSGNLSAILDYDQAILDEPQRSNVLSIGIKGKNAYSSGEISLHTLTAVYATLDILEDNPLFKIGPLVQIVDENPCGINWPNSLVISNCKIMTVGGHKGIEFWAAQKTNIEGKDYRLLGKIFLVFTDRHTWPALAVVVMPPNIDRNLFMADSENTMMNNLSKLAADESDTPFLKEANNIISRMRVLAH